VAVTLAECAFDTGGIGFEVDLPAAASAAATLFGESASRAIVSVETGNLPKLLQLAGTLGVPARAIGTTRGSSMAIAIAGRPSIDCAVAEAEQVWAQALGRFFAGRAA
jgi:phosphoribosylformylglycinamidine synthase